MVADPVLIDTARHYAELDALDALERYTEAHGEPSWETCEYYPDECAGCKIRNMCISTGREEKGRYFKEENNEVRQL
jgi:hypothetical protein